ncbi:MAG: hypothetical protein HC902_06625 [Calothrix sp. SM1_5_4]|nr:hypothetical protein [Calothrix sp. SM1_5_4]
MPSHLRFKLLMIYSALFFCSLGSAGTEVRPRVQEYFLVSVPGLSPLGSAYISWFFSRSGVVWHNGKLTDLNQISWPQWDAKQIPAALVPATNQTASLVLLDDNRKVVDEFELKTAFQPEDYAAEKNVVPTAYQIKILLDDGRLELRSPVYPWHAKRRIAHCNVRLSDESDSPIANNRKLRLCIDTISAYLSDSNADKRQVYVNLSWPAVKGRENISHIQSVERDLRPPRARRAHR